MENNRTLEKTNSFTHIIKPILFFGAISMGIAILRRLIFSEFDLAVIFNFDYLVYALFLEFVFLLITAYLAHIVTKSIVSNKLEISLIKALIFAVIYAIISLIASRIISIAIGAGITFRFDIYESFIKYIPNGLTEGILFMLVLTHFNTKKD